MGKFAARPLEALEAIYRFIGDSGPFRVDTKSPIQLVHGVERESELGAGFVANLSYPQVTAGGGIRVFSGIDAKGLFAQAGTIGQELSSLGRTYENTDVWLVDIWPNILITQQNDLNDAVAYCQSPDDLRFRRQSTQDYGLVAFGNLSLFSVPHATAIYSGTQFLDGLGGVHSTRYLSSIRLPMRFENIYTSVTDDTTGVVNVRWQIICAFMPANAEPPKG